MTVKIFKSRFVNESHKSPQFFTNVLILNNTCLMTKIKQIGSIMKVDDQGYLVPFNIVDNFQTKWEKPIQEILKGYLDNYNKDLHSVYIRGSVARGLAIDFISDLDTLCIINLPIEKLDTSWATSYKMKVNNKYDFINGIEQKIISINELFNNNNISNSLRFHIKTQSKCIYGENLTSQINPMKFDDSISIHKSFLKNDIEDVLSTIDNEDQLTLIETCSWIMKRIPRSAFEVVMLRVSGYTRDLYYCYLEFSRFYPQYDFQMKKVLELAVYPKGDKNLIKSTILNMGRSLVEIIDELANKDSFIVKIKV